MLDKLEYPTLLQCVSPPNIPISEQQVLQEEG